MLEIERTTIAGAVVAYTRLRGTKSLNVVDIDVMTQANADLDELLQQPQLRCVILSGASEAAFVGGANMNSLGSLDQRSCEPFIRSIHDFCASMRAAPVPVIARMQGYCLGAGLEIAAACDMRVGDDSVRCGMPEVRAGVPSVIEAALLPLQIGWGKARELMLRGHIIDADECLRIGLLQHCVTRDALDPLVAQMVEDIVDAAPGAIAAQKRLFLQWEDAHVSDAIELGVAALKQAYGGDEPAAYVARFFERKRRAAD